VQPAHEGSIVVVTFTNRNGGHSRYVVQWMGEQESA
jgi:hypothetical protein